MYVSNLIDTIDKLINDLQRYRFFMSWLNNMKTQRLTYFTLKWMRTLVPDKFFIHFISIKVLFSSII